MNFLKRLFGGNSKSDIKETDELILRTTYVFYKAMLLGQTTIKQTLQALNQSIENLTEKQKQLLVKEMGRLYAFWLTREIWERIIQHEEDAKKINQLLFSFFQDKYNIHPKDIEEYVKASGSPEEVKIFGRNVTNIFDVKDVISMFECNAIATESFEALIKITIDGFIKLPTNELCFD